MNMIKNWKWSWRITKREWIWIASELVVTVLFIHYKEIKDPMKTLLEFGPPAMYLLSYLFYK